jgi:hypothetical protein
MSKFGVIHAVTGRLNAIEVVAQAIAHTYFAGRISDDDMKMHFTSIVDCCIDDEVVDDKLCESGAGKLREICRWQNSIHDTTSTNWRRCWFA